MELRQLITVLGRNWLAIALLIALGAGAGLVLSSMTPRAYTAQTTVLVTTTFGSSISDLNQSSSFTERQVSTYAEVARSPRTLDRVAEDLGLGTDGRGLRSSVTASVRGTQLIDIRATASAPARAADLANSTAANLADVIDELSPRQQNGQPSVLISSISDAVPPSRPSEPNTRQNLLFGGLLGFFLGLGWAALRTALDVKVHSEDDVRKLTDRAILGTISVDPDAGRRAKALARPQSLRAEEYRQLRTNFQFVDPENPPRVLLVTSSRGGEGKSLTSINLAMTLASAGQRVCLVDADVRRPSVARYLGLEGAVGLTTVLIGHAELDDTLQVWGEDGLCLLAAGQVPPNPSELLGSAKMRETLDQLRDRFDIVVVDTAPLLPVTDAAILSTKADGVLLVVGCGMVARDQLTASLAALDAVDAHILGLVVNRDRKRRGRKDTYGYTAYGIDTGRTRRFRRGAKDRRTGSVRTAAAAAVAATRVQGEKGVSVFWEPTSSVNAVKKASRPAPEPDEESVD